MWSGADGSVGREFWLLLLQNNADKGKGGREAGRQDRQKGMGWDAMGWLGCARNATHAT